MIKYSLLPINLQSGGFRGQPILDTITIEAALGNDAASVTKIANFIEVFNSMIDFARLGYRVVSPVLTLDVTIKGSIPQLTDNFSPDNVSLNIKSRQSSDARLITGLTLSKVTTSSSALSINYAAGLETDYGNIQPLTIGMAAYDQPIQIVGTSMRETPYSKISCDALNESGEVIQSYSMTSGFVLSTSGKVMVKMAGTSALTSFKDVMPYAANTCVLRLNRQTTGQLEDATIPFTPLWQNRLMDQVEATENPHQGSIPTGTTITCGIISMKDVELESDTYDLTNIPPLRIVFNYNPTTGIIVGGVYFISPLTSAGVIDTNIANCVENNSGFMIIPITMDSGAYLAPLEGTLWMELALIRNQLTSFNTHSYFQLEIQGTPN